MTSEEELSKIVDQALDLEEDIIAKLVQQFDECPFVNAPSFKNELAKIIFNHVFPKPLTRNFIEKTQLSALAVNEIQICNPELWRRIENEVYNHQHGRSLKSSLSNCAFSFANAIQNVKRKPAILDKPRPS